ncbi:MAG: gamma-glutamyl-gamma-aminobutyrate hydrolase family protein [Candidatus Tectomicrobia bacterium]|nr:gamma-glutamyl-gamma-aminobutyrate hydrolase family protein [Candidatus Tectomicrobia bacterium]
MRPRIGLTSDYDLFWYKTPDPGEQPRHYLKEAYSHAIEAAGGAPWIIPATLAPELAAGYVAQLDGLVLTGSGSDIEPERYGEEPLPQFGYFIPSKAEFEVALIAAALERDLPLLGICGGLQVLNVAGGGSLYQDIGAQLPGALKHRQETPSRYSSHRVKVEPGTRLAKIVGADRLRVNSTHHQAAKEVADGFIVCARADDGVIEAIEHAERPFVLAVQWHPEILAVHHDPYAQKLFAAFVSAAQSSAQS